MFRARNGIMRRDSMVFGGSLEEDGDLDQDNVEEYAQHKIFKDISPTPVLQPSKSGVGGINKGDRVGVKSMVNENSIPQFYPRKQILHIPSSSSTLGNLGFHNMQGRGIQTNKPQSSSKQPAERNNIRLVL